MGKLGWMSRGAAHGWKAVAIRVVAAGLAAAIALLSAAFRPAAASPPATPYGAHSSLLEANTSEAAHRDALRSIPLDKLAAEDRAKVEAVLANVSLFRRLPIKVIDCDPDMYLFLVRHPDVVVNIWEVFKISRLQFRQTGEGRFHVTEPSGVTASVRFVHNSHDTHVVYGEGVYQGGGPLARPVKGRGVLVLKTGYVRETNDRYYVTSRMDCFLTVEPAGAEFLTKTVAPLVGRTMDNNFVLTLAFVGSLSRTAELNGRGVRRLAAQLARVEPEVREQFSDLAGKLATRKPAAEEAARTSRRAELATRPQDRDER
jgi:hypothetical protein